MRGGTIALVGSVAAVGLAMVAMAAPPPPMPADAARGERLYNAGTCQGCHGVDGVYPVGPAMVGPPLIGPIWRYGGDPASIARSIREGSPLWMKAMGGETLSEAQIADIVAYLKYRERTATPAERAIAMSRFPSGPPQGIVHSAVEDFRVEAIAKGISHPYAFDFLPDGRILISETAGPLRIVDHGRLLAEAVAGAPVGDTTGMTGWIHRANMSVAVHPNFKVNGWVYLLTTRHAAHPAHDSAPEIATIWRGRLVGNRWLDNRKILEYPLEGTDSDRMKFDKQGYLYVGTVGTHGGYTGVDGEKQPPQDLSSPEGKILRMKDDGSVPADNPFVHTPGAYPYIWSYGHREPSGLTFDGNGELWNVEDGERGGDEMNHIRKGHNYGWPVITWGHPYIDTAVVPSHTAQIGMEQPVVSWAPSPAVSDVEWYGGSAFPAWRGSFFVGTMKQHDLYRITVDGDREVLREVVLHNVDRLRDIATGPDGLIYLLTDGGDLLRLVPAKQ